MDMSRYSLSYAGRGWSVLPAWWPTESGCACRNTGDCPSPGKHPIFPGGWQAATTDELKVCAAWVDYPDANIAIATGKPSGLLVLDIDHRHGGDESLRDLEYEHGVLPLTPRVVTGGGVHYYFAYPGYAVPSSVSLAPGIDVRADGGIVIAPPSLHPSGQRYAWDAATPPKTTPLAPAPGWLMRLIVEHRAREKALPLPALIHQGRNVALTSLAGTLRARGLHQQVLYDMLLVANGHLCRPPLEDAEVEAIASGVAARYTPRYKLPHERDFASEIEKLG